MKTIAKIFLSLALMVFIHQAQASNPTGITSYTFGGKVVSVWTALDSSSNSIIQASVGSLITNPNTWTTTTISSSITGTNIQFYEPELFSSTIGDVVVLFNYIDSSGNPGVVAAALPVASSTWSVSVISNSSQDYASNMDHNASIDSLGNVIASWTSYNSSITAYEARGAIGAIGLLTTTWGSPFTIAQ